MAEIDDKVAAETEEVWSAFYDKLGSDPAQVQQEYDRIMKSLTENLRRRGFTDPAGGAQKILLIIARQLRAGKIIDSKLAAYAAGFAKHLDSEDRRSAWRKILQGQISEEALTNTPNKSQSMTDEQLIGKEREKIKTECFKSCFNQLGTFRDGTDKKEFFAAYNMLGLSAEEQKRLYGREFDLSAYQIDKDDDATRTRASRIYNSLKQCVPDCIAKRYQGRS